jgi:hypothetical protein
MFLVFAVAINGHIRSLTGGVKRNVVSRSDAKCPAIVQVHDERLPGTFKLQQSLRDAHVATPVIRGFQRADQKRYSRYGSHPTMALPPKGFHQLRITGSPNHLLLRMKPQEKVDPPF